MKYLLNFILLFLALNATAQVIYQSGAVITKDNDTIRGLIDYKSSAYTLQTVVLKASVEAKRAASFAPADLKSFFVIPGNFYLSYTGRISNNKNSYPNIDTEKDTTTTTASIFLQRIASGSNVALYVNTDKLKTRFFLKEKYSTPVELIYYEYGNSSEKPHVINAFTNYLTALYEKYNDKNSKKMIGLNNTEFTQAGLINAINIINDYVPEKDRLPTYSRFFIGASFARVSSHSDISYAYDEPSKLTNTTYSPQINFGMDIGNRPGLQRATFRAALGFSYFKPRYSFSYSPGGNTVVNNNMYHFDQYNVSFTPQLLYNVYNNASYKFFLGAGVSIYYSIYSNQAINYYQITSFSPYAVAPATDNSIKYSGVQVTIPLQAGVVLNKMIDMEVIYLPPTTIGKTPQLTLQSFGIGIHYLFQHTKMISENVY